MPPQSPVKEATERTMENLDQYVDDLLKKEVKVTVDKKSGVVVIEKHPFDESMSNSELRKIAKSWAKRKYNTPAPTPENPRNTKPMVRKNIEKNHDIEIESGGIGKTVRESRDVLTLYSLAALPEMIEHMKFVGSEPPSEKWKKREPRALRAERYEVKVKIGENTYAAHFLIRVRKRGMKEVSTMEKFGYYNHYVE